MGNLAKIFQEEILKMQPWGMNVYCESKLLSNELEKTLGFSPKVDLLLENNDQTIRYWIEFEISRADPVANHTKFVTSFFFQPMAADNIFVSMASRHVSRGRASLGASTIILMLYLGICAFQTTLMPKYGADEIKHLNHLTLDELRSKDIDLQSEIDRIGTITKSLGKINGKKIHFAANSFEVYINLLNWNHDIQYEQNQDIWRRRTIKYFVYNPWTRQFAPSKFCAYTMIPDPINNLSCNSLTYNDNSSMTIPVYVQIDQNENIFDGHKARLHLENNLGFSLIRGQDNSSIMQDFEYWQNSNEKFLNIARNDPWFII